MISALSDRLAASGLYLTGRFALWEYFNMDVAMASALSLAPTVFGDCRCPESIFSNVLSLRSEKEQAAGTMLVSAAYIVCTVGYFTCRGSHR